MAAAVMSSVRGLLSMLSEPTQTSGAMPSASSTPSPTFSGPRSPQHPCHFEYEELEHRELASLLVCKEFYYLGKLNDSLSYALGARSLIDVSED